MNPLPNATRAHLLLPILRCRFRLRLARLGSAAAWSAALSCALPAALCATGVAKTAVLTAGLAACAVAHAQAPARRSPAPSIGAADYASRPEVKAFIAEMAERHGFIESELLQAFSQVHYNDEAVRLMTPAPPAAGRSWHAYRARFLDALRIREGLRFWREHEQWLELAAARYGVPPEIIVAIIGVETIYGRRTGEHRVLDVLTTLAFDYPRRADYFRAELGEFLLYSREANLDVFSVRGSYAGAIGLPQFMPGSIRRFAVDFDEDGRVDLRSTAADAIGSVARFLAEHGWRAGEPVRFEMLFDSEGRLAPLIEAGIRPQFTIDELAGYGVSSAEPVSFEMPLALIDLPNGDKPTSYYLGAPNFFAITRYNRSSFYAMAVYELARTLAARR
ncbi:MAG: lytic murein transglycosylase B [Burkholderiaceae bacterium]|nr:lytic murein transglycosylase B [Burkholderiaceae bacterium]